jgi:hypothetical protein
MLGLEAEVDLLAGDEAPVVIHLDGHLVGPHLPSHSRKGPR